MQLLLKGGADPNRSWAPGCGGVESELWVGARGVTPLMIATAAGDAVFVKLLIDAGANVAATDSNGHNALWYARQVRTPSEREIVALLEPRS